MVRKALSIPSTKGFLPEKYAKGYKGAEDWLSDMISGEVTTKDKKTGKRGPIDVSALFALAQANNVNVDKHEPNTGVAGFAGRFRMTLRNMLQATTKRRHGLFGMNGKWSNAPGDWLKAKGAPDAPTEKRDGTKIAKPKAEKKIDEKKDSPALSRALKTAKSAPK